MAACQEHGFEEGAGLSLVEGEVILIWFGIKAGFLLVLR